MRRRRSRPLLLGEAPSRTSGRAPFAGYAGRRLAELAGLDDVRDAFDLANLLGRWSGRSGKGSAFPMARARMAAARLAPRLRGRVVVVAGKRAAAALGLRAAYLEPALDPRGFVYAVVLHSSGVNRWWNDPANEAMASDFLRLVARGILP